MMGTGGPDNFHVIIIVGPKHSGKTSAGRALARLWEGVAGGPEPVWPGIARFIDLDELVEARTGKSPRFLYRTGPEVFRKAEAEALRSLLEGGFPGERRAGRGMDGGNGKGGSAKGCITIVAAGGGLADNCEALELLRTNRVAVICLEVPVETAWERIRVAAEQSGELPPFLDTEDPRHTHRLLHERRGRIYRDLASVIVKARDTPEETAAAMLQQLGLDPLQR
jgi:shikimate kinase